MKFSRAGFTAGIAAYRQTVLSAFQEVEDQLAAQRLLGVDLAAEQAALAAAQRTLVIAQNRYRAGLVTYLEVASAQNSALEHERTVVRLRAQRLTARVALIKALGGGWESPELAAASSSGIERQTP
jgi:outer membrane protein TolC